MNSLESDLERAQRLSVETLADAIETIGFECTRCGACCKAGDSSDGHTADESVNDQTADESPDDHTATVFPDEVRTIRAHNGGDWRDIARPMPYGLTDDGDTGETLEWALQTDACGDCTFYNGETNACTVYNHRPLVCQTYPFSVALGGTTQPLGETVQQNGMVRAHECEGLGRDISREEAVELAVALKQRAIRELNEAISLRDSYESVGVESGSVVVHDSEGPKRPDGTPIDQSTE